MTTEERIKTLEDEIASLKAECKKKEKVTRFEPNEKENYAFVNSLGEVANTYGHFDKEWDESRKNYNNVFRENSKDNVQFYINNILKVQNRLMQLHEEFCPEHRPNMNDCDELKYCVYFDYPNRKWRSGTVLWVNKVTMLFPQGVIDDVVDILNNEKFMYEEWENDNK